MVSTEAIPHTPTPPPRAQRESLTIGMWLIVALKSATALLLWATFVLLLIARRNDPQDFITQLVRHLFRGNPPGVAIRYIVDNTEFITKTMITRVAVATVAYALVESTEAIGLILRKVWAEWLVILVTVSFIPLEMFEIAMRPRPLKILTCIANIAVLIYLLKRLLDKRAEERAILGHV